MADIIDDSTSIARGPTKPPKGACLASSGWHRQEVPKRGTMCLGAPMPRTTPPMIGAEHVPRKGLRASNARNGVQTPLSPPRRACPRVSSAAEVRESHGKDGFPSARERYGRLRCGIHFVRGSWNAVSLGLSRRKNSLAVRVVARARSSGLTALSCASRWAVWTMRAGSLGLRLRTGSGDM